MNPLPSAFLVLPTEKEKTIPTLNRKVRTLALRQLLTFPVARVSTAMRECLLPTRRVLKHLLSHHPALLMEVMGNPDVLNPLLVLAVGEEFTKQTPDSLLERCLPPLLASLAHLSKRGGVSEAIIFDRAVGTLHDALGYRSVHFDPPARGLLVDPLGLEVNLRDESKRRITVGASEPSHPDITLHRPFHRLHKALPKLQFSTIDSNPLSMFEAHPDKEGNAISLGDKPLKQWLETLHEALELIRLTLPGWFDELRHSMRRLIPVGYLPERHLSASYREAPGLAYLTLCDNPLTMAEAIIHETQHTKANLLSWIDPILHNAHTCWTESPVRPDLRPLWGVFLAVHAFVPVAALHERLAEMDHPITHTERFPRRRAEVLAGNNTGMNAVLGSAEATPSGDRLIKQMNHLHRRLVDVAPPPPAGMDLDPLILPPS